MQRIGIVFAVASAAACYVNEDADPREITVERATEPVLFGVEEAIYLEQCPLPSELVQSPTETDVEEGHVNRLQIRGFVADGEASLIDGVLVFPSSNLSDDIPGILADHPFTIHPCAKDALVTVELDDCIGSSSFVTRTGADGWMFTFEDPSGQACAAFGASLREVQTDEELLAACDGHQEDKEDWQARLDELDPR